MEKQQHQSAPSKRITIVVFFLLLVTIGLLLFVRADNQSPITSSEKVSESDAIQITFLDIGQGDATFIQWQDGTQMLVDCSKDARVLEALGRTMPFYDKQIDYLLVTHPDLDHYGGCTDVLKRFDVDHIVYTGLQKNDGAWKYFLQAAQDEGAEIHIISQQQQWSIRSSTISFLYPDHDVAKEPQVPGYTKKENNNNTSIIAKLSYGDMDVLLAGDAEQELEEYLVKKYPEEIDVELLKVSHHGSGGASSKSFVEGVSPQHAVISVGKNNSYGHPSGRILKRLERVRSSVWRTDMQGDILFNIYPYSVEPVNF